MDEALCSILCEQDEWHYDPNNRLNIKFNKDGTGEVSIISRVSCEKETHAEEHPVMVRV